jgi:hypothetical protein
MEGTPERSFSENPIVAQTTQPGEAMEACTTKIPTQLLGEYQTALRRGPWLAPHINNTHAAYEGFDSEGMVYRN